MLRARAAIVAAVAVTAMGFATPRAQTAAPADQPVTLETAAGTLAGSLRVPPGGRPPVVLLIAGSGPTDRDGNTPLLPGKNDSLKLLADALAAEGLASLRYDKRGVGASAKAFTTEAELRFEHLVEDAARWIVQLRNDGRFSTITVAGHSEGSLIGLLAARAARADAFVSIAGVGRRASDVLREQLRPQLAAQPDVAEANERILRALEAGQTVDAVPPQPLFTALYRASVQPYLISWFKYQPAEELARLTIPSLILQGTTDVQVSVLDAKALAAAPGATLRIIDGMNHVLKAAPADPAANIKTYSDPSLPIVPAAPAAIAAFVRGLRPARHPEGERRSPRTLVMGDVHGARLSIEYGRPSKRGRAIWGALVPYTRWWMPGADEATTFVTSETLEFASLVLPAGEYTIYTEPGGETFSLIFNRATGVFHTQYDPARDLGRVEMQRAPAADTIEGLTFSVAASDAGGVLSLGWDDRVYAATFRVQR
jgi:pimeloyl-ACP methyl ester carboxylesterase